MKVNLFSLCFILIVVTDIVERKPFIQEMRKISSGWKIFLTRSKLVLLSLERSLISSY